MAVPPQVTRAETCTGGENEAAREGDGEGGAGGRRPAPREAALLSHDVASVSASPCHSFSHTRGRLFWDATCEMRQERTLLSRCWAFQDLTWAWVSARASRLWFHVQGAGTFPAGFQCGVNDTNSPFPSFRPRLFFTNSNQNSRVERLQAAPGEKPACSNQPKC